MPAGTASPIIEEARKRFQKCAEAEENQRTRIVAAKKFHALDQWPEAIKLQREGAGSISGQSPQPPRPCLIVDRLSQPMRRVSNTIKNLSVLNGLVKVSAITSEATATAGGAPGTAKASTNAPVFKVDVANGALTALLDQNGLNVGGTVGSALPAEVQGAGTTSAAGMR